MVAAWASKSAWVSCPWLNGLSTNRRPAASVAALMARPGGHLLRLSLPTRMAISATFVRERLALGDSVRYLLPEAVIRHIEAHGLYCPSST